MVKISRRYLERLGFNALLIGRGFATSNATMAPARMERFNALLIGRGFATLPRFRGS
jgi:hypothetical protein